MLETSYYRSLAVTNCARFALCLTLAIIPNIKLQFLYTSLWAITHTGRGLYRLLLELPLFAMRYCDLPSLSLRNYSNFSLAWGDNMWCIATAADTISVLDSLWNIDGHGMYIRLSDAQRHIMRLIVAHLVTCLV